MNYKEENFNIENIIQAHCSHISADLNELILQEIKPLADEVGLEYHFTFNDRLIKEALKEYIQRHTHSSEGWLMTEPYKYACPVCGKEALLEEVLNEGICIKLSDYCPYCGTYLGQGEELKR